MAKYNMCKYCYYYFIREDGSEVCTFYDPSGFLCCTYDGIITCIRKGDLSEDKILELIREDLEIN